MLTFRVILRLQSDFAKHPEVVDESSLLEFGQHTTQLLKVHAGIPPTFSLSRLGRKKCIWAIVTRFLSEIVATHPAKKEEGEVLSVGNQAGPVMRPPGTKLTVSPSLSSQ